MHVLVKSKNQILISRWCKSGVTLLKSIDLHKCKIDEFRIKLKSKGLSHHLMWSFTYVQSLC